MTETSVAVASGQISRKVVGMATIAISSGTIAIHEAKTKRQDEQRAAARDQRLDGQARAAALVAVGRGGAQRVEAGDVHGRSADGDAGERGLRARGPRPGPGSTPPRAGIETSAKVVRPSSETKARSCVDA